MEESGEVLLLKIGETDCPKPFHPTSGDDWEGGEFRFPSIQKMPDANALVLPQGTSVYVWTHKGEDQAPGQGIIAIGHLSRELDTQGTERSVCLVDVQTFNPAISIETLRTLEGRNAVISKARNYTLRHALVVDAGAAQEFRKLLDTILPTQAQAKTREPWRTDELQACFVAYLEMLAMEQAEKPYNKRQVNTALRDGPLFNRSAGAVEFRMQNISFFFESQGLPTINGYKTRDHIGPRAMEQLSQIWAAISDIKPTDFVATDDDEQLRNRANRLRKRIGRTHPMGNPAPPRKARSASGFVRSPAVVAYVQNRAKGRCELCGDDAPFLDKDGLPFLEVHHVRFLAHGGPDVIENAAALCPNCHSACHHSANPDTPRRRLISQIKDLEDFPIRDIKHLTEG